MRIAMGSLLRLADRYIAATPLRVVPRPVLAAVAAVLTSMVAIVALIATGITGGQSAASTGLPQGSGMLPNEGGQPTPAGIPTTGPSPPGASGAPAGRTSAAAFSRIILPDLLIVMPSGLTKAEIAGLHQINGVRNMITFDGAQIRVSGQPASVIGVNPEQFRSWVPLGTATDQQIWTRLAAGDFVASSQAAARLGLSAGRDYQLTGASSVRDRFAVSAQLGIAGIDLLVSQATSARLGLVHLVAALVSAPGMSVARLKAQVKIVLGASARVVDLRGSRPVTVATPAHITSYLQLFQASAATYCPQMSWTVLAAIGQIESADGQNMGPSSAGALGPMQFLPSTWAEWGIDGFGPAGRQTS